MTNPNLPVARDPSIAELMQSLPEDVRADLMRSQADSIGSSVSLPKVAVMAAGVGLFEFNDTQQTVASFDGVILGSHPRNVLWDKPYGQQPVNEEEGFPACSSRDGVYGTPREGFLHEALGGRPGRDTDRIECATCPYNKFGTGNKLVGTRNPKGKAVDNKRSVYILMLDRELPIELVLPTMSLQPWDAYNATLMNLRTPVQAIVTRFTQKKVPLGSGKYAVVQFENVQALDPTSFRHVLEKRKKFQNLITPATDIPATVEPSEGGVAAAQPVQVDMSAAGDEEDDGLPF